MFVIERALHTTTGISTVWHSSFLPSGYGRGSGQGHPQLCQPRGDPGLGDHPALHPTGVWLGRCRSAARCWCFCRMSLSSTRQVLGGRGLCPPAWAVPACCLAAEWGTPFPAFLLPGGTEPQPPFPKQPLDWEEDVQLYSWFLDRKVRWWDKGTWDCATPQQSLPGDTVGNRLASSPHKRLKCGRGPRHPPHPTLALWLRGGHWRLCPPCPPHRRRSCEHPTLLTSSSTPSSGRCWLTSSRPCSCISPVTPSPSPPNSSLPSPASSPPGPALPLPGLPAPSPALHLTTLQLMRNKASSAVCPSLFALGKLRHGEGRWYQVVS